MRINDEIWSVGISKVLGLLFVLFTEYKGALSERRGAPAL